MQETVNFLKKHWNDYKALFGKTDKRYVEHVLNHPENKIFQVQACLRLLNQEKQGDRVLLEKVYSIISDATIEEIRAILKGLPKKQTFTPIFHAREFEKENEPGEIARIESKPVTSSQSAGMSQRVNFTQKLKLLCELKLKLNLLNLPEEKQLNEAKKSIFYGIENRLIHGKKHPQVEQLIAENISYIRDEAQQEVIRKFYADASVQIMAMNHPPKEGYEGPYQVALNEIVKVLSTIPLAEDRELKSIPKALEKELIRLQKSLKKPLEFEEIEELIRNQPYPFAITKRIDYILGDLKKMGF